MLRYLTTAISTVLLCSNFCFCQKLVAKLDFTESQPATIRAMAVGDSLFLSWLMAKQIPSSDGSARYSSLADEMKYAWINGEGVISTIPLKETKNSSLLAAKCNNGVCRYYTCTQKKNLLQLEVLETGNNGKAMETKAQIDVPGYLVGSYIDNNLFLVCYSKKDYLLHLIEIDSANASSQRMFKLTHDLAKYRKKGIVFLDQDVQTNFSQAWAAVKIYRQKDQIVMVIDEPYDEFAAEQPGHTKTTIATLNLKDGSVVTKGIYGDPKSTFASTLIGDKVIRAIHFEKGLTISVYDINQSRELKSYSLKEGDFKNSVAYVRDGRSLATAERPGKVISGYYPIIIALDSASGGAYQLAIGSLNKSNPEPIILLPVAPLINVMLSLSSMVIAQLSMYTHPSAYLYYATGSDADLIPISPLQQIDEFELQAKDEIFFKGYLTSAKGVYAFYQRRKSEQLEIWFFGKA